MDRTAIKTSLVSLLCGALALGLVQDLSGQTASAPLASPIRKAAPIPTDQIGVVAGKQYSGEGLAITASPDGAQLRCVFQSLSGRVTTEGLWLTSTTDNAKGEPFRVTARMLGRERADTLPPAGEVRVAGQVAQFVRPGLTEEFSVSMDGVRQDFVIKQRPAGIGPVRLELEVTGARAEARGQDVRLVLEDRGRILAYNRLKAQDAKGREVEARMEVVSTNRLAVVLEDAAAEYPVRIDPTFSDANWISLGGLPGVDETVYAAVVDGAGNLYIGGDFTTAGTVAANKIARWNGSQWSALGSGMDLSVNALAIWNGQLYAGGEFSMAGGNPANCIAKWDGSNWSPLGTGMTGAVPSSAVWALAAGDFLYVGGDFTTAGGNPAQCLAQWSGTQWSSVGNAVQSTVYALAVSGKTLYAAGIDIALGTNLNDNVEVAAWDGTNWSRLGTGNFFGTPLALAASGVDLYIGGEFALYDETNSTSIPVNYIAKWDGTQWSALGTGMSDRVISLAISPSGVLYAGGQFTSAGGNPANYIAQWSGNIWSGVGPGTGGNVYTIVLSGGTMYVGGGFGTAGTNAAICIAKWDGANWSPLGSGMDGAVDALAVSGSTVYAGGTFISAGTNAAHYVAQWNGAQWSGVGSGMNSNVLALASSGGTLYAGGQFTSAGGNAANEIAQWNGTNWSALGTGMNGTVDALAISGTNLYAGGAFTTAGGNAANDVAEWKGTNWLALGTGMNGAVDALAVSGNTLYAGGAFTTAGTNTAANYIAPWNGTNWLALGSGMNSNVLALLVSGTNLYAGGNFTTAGGTAASALAEWKGSNWSAVGTGLSGPNSYVASLAALNGTLYVGGYFTTAGGNSASNIAQWDGTNWSALGSGVGLRGFNYYPFYYPSVNALAVSGNNLFAGGQFYTAGTNISVAMAEAILGALNVPPVIVTTDGRFGFTNHSSLFGFDISNSTTQTLVLGSSNLVNWVPLQTNVLGNSPWYFTDTAASNFHNRFYRVETP